MAEGGSPHMDGTSRVTGDGHARFCERLGVQFPGPTRRLRGNSYPYRDQSTLSRAGGPSRKTGNELLIYEDFNGGRGCILG